MESQFGARIRALREDQNLFLFQDASLLEMDTVQLSNIEKSSRQLEKEQIPVIAEILKADNDESFTLLLVDQLMKVLYGEHLTDEALKSVTKIRKQDNVN